MGPSRLLTDNDTAADAGLSSESEATIILRQNIVTCSYKGEFARFVYEDNDDDDDNDDDAHVLYDLYDFVDDDDDEDDDLDLHHSESLFVVQITNGATTIVPNEFRGCNLLASVTIPDSVFTSLAIFTSAALAAVGGAPGALVVAWACVLSISARYRKMVARTCGMPELTYTPWN